MALAMIVPLGPQNMMVLNQGIHRQYHLMVASLCTLSDIILVCAGIFGGSTLLANSPWLLALITWGGVAFLLWYGWRAFKAAWMTSSQTQRKHVANPSRWSIILMLMAVTWMNPHVYLDTFVVLGSIGGQLSQVLRGYFAAGAVLAAAVWFFALALLAARLAPVLRNSQVQRGINIAVGCVMWMIAFQLARQGWHSLMNLPV